MLLRAYDESYLCDGMRNLGEAVDYAVNACHLDADVFMGMFRISGIGRQFAVGEPKVIAGLSGTELVCEVFRLVGYDIELPDPQVEYDYSPEYWAGWILAYYQWYSDRSFKDILSHISMAEIIRLYPALHEASEDKFVDTVNHRIRSQNLPTRLQTLRRYAGYSQRKLSEKSGVNLRTLQQYEMRAKDINKAAGEKLYALAKTLGCRMEDLLEYEIRDVEEE